jgi:Arc/MetJ-type ribon-helix-helix transcriptional regulator
MYYHTETRRIMPTSKVAVTLDGKTIEEVDRWVREGRYPNRSRAIQAALDEMTRRTRRSRLAVEAAKLDAAEERSLAEEAAGDGMWPDY